MAKIEVNWNRVRIPASDTKNWRDAKRWLDEQESDLGKRSVYVIRTTKPFAIAYNELASPVMYIGEGHFGQRLRSHLENWIFPLVKDLPSLSIEVFYAKITVRNNLNAHRDVEADLIHRFAERFKSIPLMNKQYEYHNREHEYSVGFTKPIQSEKGAGYKWALRPLISNMAYPASLKGLYL